MNNGIFVQDVYGKIGSDNGLPRPLVGVPSVPMPYHCFGPESRLDSKNLILVVDLAFSQSNTITFTAGGSATRNWSIDWGDGIVEQYTSFNNTLYSHTYNTRGVYTIQITGDVLAPRFASQPVFIRMNSFGQIPSNANYSSAFRFNTNLMAVAGNLPSTTSTIFQIFLGCTQLNDPNISLWNTSNVTDMGSAFQSAASLNQPLNNWDVSKCTSFSNMFNSATSFNGDLKGWQLVAAGTSCASMFQSATNFTGIGLDSWNTSGVTNMNNMFQGAVRFNQNLSSWDVSKVVLFNHTFNGANSFNQSLSSWVTSSATSMESMFANNTIFNSSVANFDTSKVTNFGNMFNGASSFNQPIGSWNVSSATNMANMFLNAINFNQSLDNWNVRKVTNFSSMFQGAIRLNSSISGWAPGADTAGANCSSMFDGASNFTGIGLETWNTSGVTNMQRMFGTFIAFNRPIGNWNVSNVTNMSLMFYGSLVFNQPLSGWNTSKVNNMSQMFNGATAFNQSLSHFNLAGLNSAGAIDAFMINKTGSNSYSTANYDDLLISWNNNKLAAANGVANWRTDLSPHFGGARYTAGGAAATARAALVSYGWTITDGGVA